MIETMELRPRISIRDSLATRGLILGAGLGLAVALCYLTVLVTVVLVLGPIVDGIITGQPVIVDGFGGDFSGTAAVITATVAGFVVGVLPATAAGALAGFGIGALLQLTAGRRRPARALGHDSPSRAAPDPAAVDRSRPDLRSWLTGTMVTCLVGVVTVIVIVTLAPAELVWSSTGLMIIWLPVLIFALAGGPFAVGLQRAALRKRSVQTSARPRRAADPTTDDAW